MENNQIDLLKNKEGKNKVAEVISLSAFHPVLERIYRENSIMRYLSEFCIFLDSPTIERMERIKLSSALIYWDIIFILMDNRLEIFADDIDRVNEMSKEDARGMEDLKRNSFLLNFVAANFYSFSHIEVISQQPQKSDLSILAIL